MVRVAYGKCNYCGNTYPVTDWYDMVEIENQTPQPWTCPGCKKRLTTQQIEITYKHEGE